MTPPLTTAFIAGIEPSQPPMYICFCRAADGCVCMNAFSAPSAPSSAMQRITFRSGCACRSDWVTVRHSAASTPSCRATTCAFGATFCSAAIPPWMRSLPVCWISCVSSATFALPPSVRLIHRPASAPTSAAPCRLLKITQPSVPGSALSE